MDQSEKIEKKNPRESANALSQLFFLWSVPTILRGAFHGLDWKDLTKCLPSDNSKDLGEKLEIEWEKELEQARKKNSSPHLRNALFKTFYLSCIVDGFLVFTFTLLKSITPVFLSQLLIQFQKPLMVNVNETAIIHDNATTLSTTIIMASTTESTIISISNEDDENIWDKVFQYIASIWTDPFWLSTLVVVFTFISCILNHHVDLRQRFVGARMRIACSAAIYRKSLRMSKRAITQTSAGNIINLLSNDVNRFDFGFIYVHFIWVLPIQACLICYLIWRKAKYAAIVGVLGLLLKTVPIQTELSRVSAILRMKIAIRTDDRVSKMNELIQGIQVIKMYAWEIPFRSVIKLARKKEVDQIQMAQYIRGIYMSTMVFTERSTLFLAILACVLEERAVTADLVFSMATFFNVLQLTAAIFYPLAVSLGAEALVSIKRIQDFLSLEEQDVLANGFKSNESKTKFAVGLSNITASWTSDYNKTLINLNCRMKAGKLCAIIGPVGSGKSSIFQLLLGELPIETGDIYINGDTSYASQDPWLFSSTVRNNILFGLEYDKLRYSETVKHCALETDFHQLPYGDKTYVGERGMSLSGGQKARISLARAVYKKSSIYLFDDPLSAVDAHVGKHLFTECLGPNGYLARQKATRILITHQIHFLKEADWIIVIDKGKIVRQGTWNDVMDIDLYQYVSSDCEKNDDTSDNEYPHSDDDDIPYIDDAPENSKGYLKLRTSDTKISSRSSVDNSMENLNMNEQKNLRDEDRNEKKIKFAKVFIEYFRAGATMSVLMSVAIFLIFSQFVTSASDYFITFWTNQELLRINQMETMFSTKDGLYIYGFLILAVVSVTLSRGFIFFAVCMRASKKLHDTSFLSLLHSPMRFFDLNPVGRILNRFSKDMGAVDESLPKAIIEAVQNLLVMMGILVLIALTTTGYTFPAALIITAILYGLILKMYLRPAKDIKRLEGSSKYSQSTIYKFFKLSKCHINLAKSPVFGQMTSTLSGISTIRASKMAEQLTSEFDKLQDVHSGVWQTLLSINTGNSIATVERQLSGC
ncbi:hypothetical protein ACKWTF_007429 [Chironomus riparius]